MTVWASVVEVAVVCAYTKEPARSTATKKPAEKEYALTPQYYTLFGKSIRYAQEPIL